MRKQVLEILMEINPTGAFEECDDFFESELLDSFDIITFVEAIESEFGIEFSGDDIIPENFMNLDAIESVVKKYL